MYTAPSLFAKHCEYNSLDDRTFFTTALEIAQKYQVDSIDKNNIPVVFGSKLLKQTKDETIVPRKVAQDRERVKRSFILLDVDYNEDEQELSEALWNRIIEFGHTYSTPVMMYPTPSWPTKPRFRAVFLTKSLLNATQYEKAVRWLADELMYEITDPMDYHISPNKNLPVFSSQDMADACYSTFTNLLLEPLPSDLWKKVSVKQRQKPQTNTYAPLSELGLAYDRDKLWEAAHNMALDEFVSTYATYWIVSRSVALDVYTGSLTEEEGKKLVTIFASGAPTMSQRLKWSSGNKRLLLKDLEILARDPEARSYARPLYSYAEFADTLDDLPLTE